MLGKYVIDQVDLIDNKLVRSACQFARSEDKEKIVACKL